MRGLQPSTHKRWREWFSAPARSTTSWSESARTEAWTTPWLSSASSRWGARPSIRCPNCHTGSDLKWVDTGRLLMFGVQSCWSDFPLSLSAALAFPLRSGEGWNWPVHQCGPGVVPGGAQEPGLLWLRQASHLHLHPPHPPCLVSLLGFISVPRVCPQPAWVLVCVSGMLAVSLQQPPLPETNTPTCWSCSISWTRRLIWRHSQEDSRHYYTPLEEQTCLY